MRNAANPWLTCDRLPAAPAAALAALHFTEPRVAPLSDRQWRETIAYCDRSQITLALRDRARSSMPEWAREVADGDLARNIERLARIREVYRSISQCLAGIDFVALKGLTQCPLFGSTPETRPQYDIDLYCPRDTVAAAHAALLKTGLEPQEGMDRFPTDHFPALIRKTGWQYRGDVFDPEMPLPVELHFQFWNGGLERLAAPGVEYFWERRVVRPLVDLPALAVPDALAFACLHLLKHILSGSARPFHVYEIGCFLHARASNEEFWREWALLYHPALRRLQAVVFRLAQEWFGCQVGPAATAEMEQLPPATRAWFDRFALSPACVPFDSNKDELWLHLSLLESRRDGFAVTRRRLLPGGLPSAVDSIYVPTSAMTWRDRVRRRYRWLRYTVSRVAHHATALPRVATSGARWWRSLRAGA